MSVGVPGARRWELAVLLLALAAFAPAWSKKDEKKKKKDKVLKEWPDEQMGPRTPDRVSASKHAAKFIACNVCHERVGSFLPVLTDMELEEIDQFMDEGLPELLGAVDEVCNTSDLAQIFERRRLDIETNPNGFARIVRAADDVQPVYDEIATEDAFDWKVFALQHACIEIFRKDGDAIAKEVKEGFDKMRATWNDDKEDNHKFFLALGAAISKGCQKASTCKAQLKMARRGENDEEKDEL